PWPRRSASANSPSSRPAGPTCSTPMPPIGPRPAPMYRHLDGRPVPRRIPRSEMRPLRIRCRLLSAVAGDFALPLDALLYYAQHRESLGEQLLTRPGEKADMTGAPLETLPLA